MWSTLRFLPSELSTLEKIMQLGSAAVIIFENTFYLLDQRRYLKQESSVHLVHVALQQYISSPNAAAVREALNSTVHTYEAGSSQWIAELAKHTQKKADLIETVAENVLKHRLPRPEV
ncbi:hypothetical protein CY34DRAFT_491747 [Suillus luteus UH-Slu-Lm8-n1]|uniref:Uncharacterized protein n=1 Tax=Suillus luteus UH-Slu-Lm8-n1 TaxID=930992 RepID=A0A0D0AR98_9AGAM|nr:hypothetical protein CY34DRAFT_491747 [Suillus luteus UH-Slu-Lm8-n1]